MDCGFGVFERPVQSRPELFGIPFAVKDEQDLAGYVTSYGIGGRTEVAQADGPLELA